MPLLLMCGQPCSGKTTVAKKLAELLREYGIEVVTINETSLGLERNLAYKGDEFNAMHAQYRMHVSLNRRELFRTFCSIAAISRSRLSVFGLALRLPQMPPVKRGPEVS
jgi:tRNA uridine 5-carbamoylmethylation protein Kti12